MNLEQTVKSKIDFFINNRALFTALDISNAIKQDGVSCHHREVRDFVRLFFSNGEIPGYKRNVIEVHLTNGNVDNALLYYPDTLSDDEVDEKYDQSRRSIAALVPPSVNVLSLTTAGNFTKTLIKPTMLSSYLANQTNQSFDDDDDGNEWR